MNVTFRSFRRSRRGLLATLAAAALLTGAIAAPVASAEFDLNNFDVTFTNQDGTPDTQAGSHPFAMTTKFGVNYTEPGPEDWLPDGELKDSIFDEVPGFVGNATAVPRCGTQEFLARRHEGGVGDCSNNTAVGLVANYLQAPFIWVQSAVFNLEPPPGVAVRLGFNVILVPVIVDITVKKDGDYNIEASANSLPQVITIFGSEFQLW